MRLSLRPWAMRPRVPMSTAPRSLHRTCAAAGERRIHAHRNVHSARRDLPRQFSWITASRKRNYEMQFMLVPVEIMQEALKIKGSAGPGSCEDKAFQAALQPGPGRSRRGRSALRSVGPLRALRISPAQSAGVDRVCLEDQAHCARIHPPHQSVADFRQRGVGSLLFKEPSA
jgi:hypothetical protein